MAQTVTVNLEVKDNTKSLKAQLKEAQAEVAALADKYGAASAQATQAARKAAELKDRIGDAKALTDAFNPDAKFKSFTATLSGVAGGFSAVQGAMGLVGAEGEEVQKMMLKVQSAMAISQGLQALGEAQDSFKQLTSVVGEFVTNLFKKNAVEGTGVAITEASVVATEAEIIATEAEAVATTEAAVAQEGLNAAMAMNPVGALVLAITALTAGLVYYFSSADKATSASEKMAKQKKEAEEASKKQSQAIAKESTEFVGLIYQLKATNAGSKERADLIKKINGTYNTTLKNLSDEAAFQQQLNAEVASYIAYQKAKYELAKNEDKITTNLEKQDEIRKKLNISQKELDRLNEKKKNLPADYLGIGQLNQQIEDQTKKLNTYQEQLDAANERLENYGKVALDTNGVIAEIEGTNGKFNTSLKKTGDTAGDTAGEIKDYAVDLNNYLDAIEADRQGRLSDARAREEQEVSNRYEKLYELADKAGIDTADLQKKQGIELGEIRKKYQKLADDENLKLMQAMDDKDTQMFLKSEQIKIDAMKDGIDKQAAIRKLAYDRGQIELQNQLDAELITYEDFQTASINNFKAYQNALSATNKDANKERKEDDQAVYEQKLALQNKYADIAIQAANLLKDTLGKSKAAQKTAVIIESAAGIAKMIIANKLANMGALATPQAIASSGVSAAPVIAANNISLGLGIAANIAATVKALKEIGGGGSVPSGGGTGGGGMAAGGGTGTGTGVNAPNFNVVGNNGINQLAQLQQQPVKAYVVGSEVSTQQALDRNRITNGTL
jgi:hypothetical protein